VRSGRPVLRDEGDAAKIERVDPAGQVLDVGAQRVLAILRRLALAEAHVIGDEHAPPLRERRDHPAVK
jgi:hypothetical protein